MARPESDNRFRANAIDVAHSRRRSTVLVGPLTLPPVAELVDRYTALADLGPLARLCLEPSALTNRWRRVPVDGSTVVATAAPLPPGAAPTELLSVMRALRAHDVAGGVRILCAGDYLVVDFCHGLGEVALVHTVIDVLLGAVDPRDPELLAPYRHRVPPLFSAALRTFGSDPRRAATLLGVHRRRPQPSVTPAPAGAPGDPFQPSPTTRFVGIPAEVVAELRQRRDAVLPDVSLVALCTYALWESLANSALAVDNIVKIPFDVRRYLPPGAGTLATFSAGLDFAIDEHGGPQRLQADIDRSVRSGRPVANLVAGAAKARRRNPPAVERHPTHPRVRLLHSNVGRALHTERWPFTDHRAAHLLIASDPMSAEGVTVTSAWSVGTLWLTAQFHANVFHPEHISNALHQVATRMGDLIRPGG